MAGKKKESIVLLATHPDDIAWTMGGTALLLKDRYHLHVLCLTKGERGYPDPQKRTGLAIPPSAELAAIREKEEAAACRMLGAELTFLGLIDQEVYADRAICEKVAGILRKIKPIALFCQWGVDVPDHAAGGLIGIKAANLAGIYWTTQIYYYECGIGGQTNQFDPDIYVNIDRVAEQKWKLAFCHATQAQGNIEPTKANNRLRGVFARCDFAEAFKTPCPLIGTRWNRPSRYLLLDL